MQVLQCKICGRVPAERFVIRRHVGMIVFQKFFKIDAPMCRDHGMKLSKEFLGKTLYQGWWGIISFFMNIGAVITDVKALGQAKRMPAPGPAPAGAMPPPPPAG